MLAGDPAFYSGVDIALRCLFLQKGCDEGRWEAGQTLSRKLMLDLVSAQQKGEKLSVDSAFIEGIRSTVTDSSLDKVRGKLIFIYVVSTVNRCVFTMLLCLYKSLAITLS